MIDHTWEAWTNLGLCVGVVGGGSVNIQVDRFRQRFDLVDLQSKALCLTTGQSYQAVPSTRWNGRLGRGIAGRRFFFAACKKANHGLYHASEQGHLLVGQCEPTHQGGEHQQSQNTSEPGCNSYGTFVSGQGLVVRVGRNRVLSRP